MPSKFLNISTDTTLGGSSASDSTVSSQKAIKAYVDSQTGTAPAFANITGQPTDNTNLASALNAKYDASNPNGYQANVIETVKVNGTALTPSSKAVDVTVPTETTVSGWGFTKNAGTVTSVNNVSPVSGNVTLSIPTVNNATLTITQGGTSKGTFTANASSDVTISLDSPNAIDNKSITENSSNQLQTVGVIDQNNTSNAIKTWSGTKAQYDALKTAHTLYEWVSGSDKAYTTTRSATTGDSVYNSSYELIGTVYIDEYSSPYVTIYVGEPGPDQLSFERLASDTSTVTIYEFAGDSNTLYNVKEDGLYLGLTAISISSNIENLVDTLYPVGSIYIGVTSTCPLASIKGTWVLVSSGRVLQGADSGHSAGTTINAGLPNITANVTVTNEHGLILSDGRSNPTGAFKVGQHTGLMYTSGAYASYVGADLGFDASLSNSIYGNSSTVQPPAYVVNIWQRTA